jgi:hypothetical protein
MEDENQLVGLIRDIVLPDVIDAAVVMDITETSLILHLKMASSWPEVGHVQASHKGPNDYIPWVRSKGIEG